MLEGRPPVAPSSDAMFLGIGGEHMTRALEYARKKVPSPRSRTTQLPHFESSSHLASPSTIYASHLNETCACGGGCPRCTTVQAKFNIGNVGDRYEWEADRIADHVMRIPEPSFQHQLPGQLENASAGSKEIAGDQTFQPMFAGPIIQPQLNAARSGSGPLKETDGMHESAMMPIGPKANIGFGIVTEADPCKRALDNCLHQVEVNYRKEVANCKKQHKNDPSELETCLAIARNSRNFYTAYCWANYYDCALS